MLGSPFDSPFGKTNPSDNNNNTFIAMRIINETSNLMYAEFVDVSNPKAWEFNEKEVNFYELYDVSNDYYEMHNIYHE